MLNQFTISVGITILAMGMIHPILINQYPCAELQQNKDICYNARLNLGLAIDFVIGILGTPLIIQGYRNLESSYVKPKINSIGLIDRRTAR